MAGAGRKSPPVGALNKQVRAAVLDVQRRLNLLDQNIIDITGSSSVVDHGALSGLNDDDHLVYALADGSRGNFEVAGAAALALADAQAYTDDHADQAVAAHAATAVSYDGSGNSVLIQGWLTATDVAGAVRDLAEQLYAPTAEEIDAMIAALNALASGSEITNPDVFASDLIAARHIASGSVTAVKIDVSQLDAISADLGSITAGDINIGGGNFTVSSAGVMTATGATITGDVTADSFTAKADNNANAAVVSSTGSGGLGDNRIDFGAMSDGSDYIHLEWSPTLPAVQLVTWDNSTEVVASVNASALNLNAGISAQDVNGGTSSSVVAYSTGNIVLSTSGGNVQFPNGSAGSPAVSFNSDTLLGVYRHAAGDMGFAAGGVRQFGINTTGPHCFNTLDMSSYGIINTPYVYAPSGELDLRANNGDATAHIRIGSSSTVYDNDLHTIQGPISHNSYFDGADVGADTSVDNPINLGAGSGANMALDGNEIMWRNNGSALRTVFANSDTIHTGNYDINVQNGDYNVQIAGTDILGVTSTSVYLPTVYSQYVSGRNVHVSLSGLMGQNTTSSLRFKTDVHDYEVARAERFIYNVRPISYRYTEEYLSSGMVFPEGHGGVDEAKNEEHLGFGAEDVSELEPYYASYDLAGKPDAVIYEKMVTPLVVVSQEHGRRIASLEDRIAALEAAS